MKLQFKILLLHAICLLSLHYRADAQTPLIVAEQIETTSANYEFRIDNLRPSVRGATFTHFWWFGDNYFSFDEKPTHIPSLRNRTSGTAYEITAIPTEGYGTGNIPPLKCSRPTPAGNPAQQRLLESGSRIKLESYRNAVLYDTTYIIVTYGNDSTLTTATKGKLILHLPEGTSLLTGSYTSHPDFLPNDEKLLTGTSAPTWTFDRLGSHEQRSILLPIRLDSTDADELNFQVDLWLDGQEEPGTNYAQGSNFNEIDVEVALSHDPNRMHESSTAKNNCKYGGNKIDYVTEFQNEGETATRFIRLEVQLDKHIELESVEELTFYDASTTTIVNLGTLNGRYTQGAGFIYNLDTKRHKLIVELNDAILQGSGDPKIRDFDLTKGFISFTTTVESDFEFGPKIKARTAIIFDQNSPIITDKVTTHCNNSRGIVKKWIKRTIIIGLAGIAAWFSYPLWCEYI